MAAPAKIVLTYLGRRVCIPEGWRVWPIQVLVYDIVPPYTGMSGHMLGIDCESCLPLAEPSKFWKWKKSIHDINLARISQWLICLKRCWWAIYTLGLYIIYFKRYDNIRIHMKRYSICIKDTFCLVLDQRSLICPQISWEFGKFNDQSNPNVSNNVLFEVSCN